MGGSIFAIFGRDRVRLIRAVLEDFASGAGEPLTCLLAKTGSTP